jgi:CubicO group peptidase (beta-lactamase class C family)
MARIESAATPATLAANGTPLHLRIEDLMRLYKVPGLSLAIIDDYKIICAKSYGITESEGAVKVSPRTLFLAGSVSKVPAAVGALSLVERGLLSLDEDVNLKLKGWKVPENEFTSDQKVTLRRILSHTSGLSVHYFPGYFTDQPLPTLPQILDGEKPANTGPVRVTYVAGTSWHYSGGGVLVEQHLMTDVTHTSFPRLMRETVFSKIGMEDSFYEQPLPERLAARAATGTYASGKSVRGRWHIYPEMAAAGLWTTPTDLAKLAIEVALAKQGRSNRVLSQSMTRQMLQPQIYQVAEVALGNKQHVDHMGLGFFLGDDKRPDLFGHIGDDEGFQAMFYMFGDSGQGAVVMANSEHGILLGDYLMQRIATEFHWKEFFSADRPRVGPPATLLLASSKADATASIHAYQQLKKAASGEFAVDKETLISVGYTFASRRQLKDAIQVLEFEVNEYPGYWNAYDSLGEMYMNAGNKELAMQNYEKSLALKPDNRGAAMALKILRGK